MKLHSKINPEIAISDPFLFLDADIILILPRATYDSKISSKKLSWVIFPISKIWNDRKFTEIFWQKLPNRSKFKIRRQELHVFL